VRPLSSAVEPTAGSGHRYRRRIALSTGAVIATVALAAAGTAAAGIGPLRGRHAAGGGSGSIDNAASTSLAQVTRQTLNDRISKDGTLGYAGSYSVVNQATGTLTALPAVGDVIGQGKVMYRVDGAPVVLLRGSIPAYRALSKGTSGPDVRQLNAALLGIGKATRDQLDPTSNKFGRATVRALKRLQDTLDIDQTGALRLGQAVFLPSAARITEVSATLGAPAGSGAVVLKASSTTRVVAVELDAAEQSLLKRGDRMTVTPPGARTTPGVVSSVSKVATKPSDGGSNDDGGRGGPEMTRPPSPSPSPARPAPAARTRSRSPCGSSRRPPRTSWRYRSTRCWRWPAAATPSRPTRPASGIWYRSPSDCSTTTPAWSR
jgi:hypothetical protein